MKNKLHSVAPVGVHRIKIPGEDVFLITAGA